MFIDKATIKVQSGRGGNGAATFRQEKFVAHGGPDGGDGGRGGSIYLVADDNMSTLLDFQNRPIYKADDGEKGSRKDQTGKSADNVEIKVPVGTIVRDIERDLLIADLKKDGEKVLVAQGGRGGKGNAKFKSNKMRVPNFSEPGEPAIYRELELELKLIADIGIIGFPNAGKSTFISKISAAKPKVANYAFTTIVPNLGVVKKQHGDSFVVADIPGIIEGAGEGKGLGFDFLRHIERTKLLIHMVDVWGLEGTNVDEFEAKMHEDPLQNFIQVNYELFKYSPELAKKKQIIILNKIEAYPDEDLAPIIEKFEEHTGLKLADQSFLDTVDQEDQYLGLFAVSAVTGEGIKKDRTRFDNGIDTIKLFAEKLIDIVHFEEKEIELDEDYAADNHDDSDFQIMKEQDSPTDVKWNIHCGKLERIMKITDLRDLDSLQHLFYVVKSMGVIEQLKIKGAKEGDTMNIDGVDFEITDAVLI
jgi:GTP-binding protein